MQHMSFTSACFAKHVVPIPDPPRNVENNIFQVWPFLPRVVLRYAFTCCFQHCAGDGVCQLFRQDFFPGGWRYIIASFGIQHLALRYVLTAGHVKNVSRLARLASLGSLGGPDPAFMSTLLCRHLR